MKKWFFISVVVIGLLITSAYIFFPKELVSSNITQLNCSINSVNRYLFNDNNWSKWWPGTIDQNSVIGKKIFKYNGNEYLITEKKYNAIDIQAMNNELSFNSTIFFLAINLDTVNVEWKYAIEATNNPLSRIRAYQEAKKVNSNLSDILKSMKAFLNNPDKVYGIHIDRTIVTDTILVTTNFSSEEYPSTEKIYSHLSGIQNYLTAHQAEQTNPPMLHIRQDSGLFKIQLAIPVNKVIDGNATYLIKRMVPGSILVAEVKGGIYTANAALKHLSTYLSDYRLSSPAIPFQSLVTNRLQQADTTKWITKIYYPVF